jgi:hypothetical protein
VIARVKEIAHEPAMQLVVSPVLPKTPEMSDWPADLQCDMVPIIFADLAAILDLFITLSAAISWRVHHFCPVLTAEGKLDCSPK